MEIIFLFILISLLWFIRQAKAILFWLYLWQLKEYHIGRFLDHFKTWKGKKLFLNWLFILKIALLFYALILSFYSKLLPWYFYAGWVFILIFLYLFESSKFFLDIIWKKINPVRNLRFLNGVKKPILTQKTLTLISANLFFIIFFVFYLYKKINLFYWFSFGLLSFDILTPLFTSTVVLLFQLTLFVKRKKFSKS